jgi:phosphatidylglycerol lysyltransferase
VAEPAVKSFGRRGAKPPSPKALAGDLEQAHDHLPERVLALVRRYGWNATSFQALDPGMCHFWCGDDACVAYADTGDAWVAAGAPLAAEDRMGGVARAFVRAAAAAGRRAAFFAVEARFVEASGFASLPIGEQAVWDPAAWPEIVKQSRSLREQLRRATAKGVTVRAVAPAQRRHPVPSPSPSQPASLDEALQAITARWLRGREMPPMGFLVRVDPLIVRDEHRLFVAERGGVPIGFLQAAPIYARRGWLLQNLLRAPDAPNGVTELLIDAAMRAAAADGAQVVTLGLAPLAGDVPRVLRVARALGRGLFDFAGLRAFRAKLRPAAWVPQHLAFPPEQGAPRSLADALVAFAGGSLIRFGLATLARGPFILVRVLAVLLVPWTAILAVAPAARWFPSPAVKWSWVAFDVALALALGRLARRWRQGLAGWLVLAVGADTLSTTTEGVVWNFAHGPSLWDASVVLVAIAAPAVAFMALFKAWRRHASLKSQ